jgi:hypothetical protein
MVNHPYDRAMAWSSLYILIPAMHTRMPALSAVMIVTTLLSIRHWLDFDRITWHKADCNVSSIVFVLHGVLMWYRTLVNYHVTVCFALASASCFIFGNGMRNKALLHYRAVQLLPHASFRFFAFWFVMFVHRQPWSWTLTVIYWLSILILGWPYPNCTSCNSIRSFFH